MVQLGFHAAPQDVEAGWQSQDFKRFGRLGSHYPIRVPDRDGDYHHRRAAHIARQPEGGR
jgi:hypothetical protein